MADTIKFEPNVPLEVALVYGQGKIIENSFGQRVMFTLVGGKVMFLDFAAAEQVKRLGVKPRQPFFLCKYQAKRGALDQWRAWLPGEECGEQPDGTFAVPAEPPGAAGTFPASVGASRIAAPPRPASAPASSQALNGNGSSNGNGHAASHRPPMPWALFMAEQTNDLVDALALSLKHAAEKHAGLVKPEDVRELLGMVMQREDRHGAIPALGAAEVK